jgi:CheY-like chemotaxis protein
VGGTSRLDFRPDGIVCHVEIPLRHVAEAGVAPRTEGAGEEPPPALRGMRVLVVEDSALVAMELETALRGQGAEVIGPVARIQEAEAAIVPVPPDAALLDIDLDGVAVFPLADALAAAGVPFVFTTGYEARLVLPPRFAGRPVLAKPYRGEDAAAALAALRPAGAG